MNKKILVLIIVVVIITVIGVITLTSSATNHFENNKLSFNYPISMGVKDDNSTGYEMITVSKGSSGVLLVTSNYSYGKDFEGSVKARYAYNNTSTQANLTKFTIDGRTAYNISFKDPSGQTLNSTIVDMGNGKLLSITQIVQAGSQNQFLTESYKAYSMIVQSLGINNS